MVLIPEHERQREFVSRRRKQQYLCGRVLLRSLLQETTGIAAISHELITARDGKPVCVGGPAVSITHTEDLIACGVADFGELGIDLERTNESRDTGKVAARFFSKQESAWLQTQERDRFFMLWVLKEAYVKAFGRSIFGSINGLRCKVVPPDIEVLGHSDRLRNLGLYNLDGVLMGLVTTDDLLAGLRVLQWNPFAHGFVQNRDLEKLALSEDLRD